MTTILLNIILLYVNVDKFTIELYFLFKLSILNKSTEKFFFSFLTQVNALFLESKIYPGTTTNLTFFKSQNP